MTTHKLSPFSDVSDALWAQAYEEACDAIYTREGADREPSEAEVLSMIERIEERRSQDAKDEHYVAQGAWEDTNGLS